MDMSQFTLPPSDKIDRHQPYSQPYSQPPSQPHSRNASQYPFPSSGGSGSHTPRSGLGTSRPGSIRASASGFHVPTTGSTGYFRSRRIQDVTTIDKPWTEIKDPQRKWHTIFPMIGIGIGLVLAALLCYQGYSTVINYDYCPVYDVDFSAGGQLDSNIWTKEVTVGGFGNGEFDMTTGDEENVFIKDGELWIKPTLQDEKLINENSAIDLTKQGICTSDTWAGCHAVTNVTNGTIVPPVKSARINTKKGATIQYGRVEVVASMPEGDWMWPAIWMLPVDNKYGEWPASGEIDIAESRGNNYTYSLGGNDYVSSSLHWGPSPAMDAYHKTFFKYRASHTTFTKTYHKFGLEWTDKYLFTYINSRLAQALYVPFQKPLWNQGDFDVTTGNGSMVVDPWSQSGQASTPFDQSYYLILNVAVGSTNSWWSDGLDGKPWVDDSPSAKKDFWAARDKWYPTWKENGQMRIKSVKMWQQAGFRGCQGK